MEKTYLAHPVWKLTAAVSALALVIGILIYTGGYENFLKLLGIKASTEQSIEITSVDQMLGTGSETWLVTGTTASVDGVSVTESSDFVPSDPDGNGMVTTLFSEEGSGNIYNDHQYDSPVIDLGTDNPVLSAILVTQHIATGANIRHSYFTAATPDGIEDATEVSLELSSDPSAEIDQVVAQIGVPANRYLRLRAEILGDDFSNRSAIYGWSIQFGDAGSEGEGTTPEPEDTTPKNILYATHIDFSEAAVMPAVINMSIYGGEKNIQPVWSEDGKSKTSLEPVYNLPVTLAPGNYFLVLEAVGYRTQVVPFAASEESIDAKVANFVPVEMSFDLNGDGTLNTMDVALLLGKISQSLE